MLSLLVLVSLADAKPKKSKAPPPPPVGWAREEGWKGDCYFPPGFDSLGEGDRKMARQQALEGMKSQWSGARDDGVSFDAGLVDEVETVLLGRPQNIEAISRANLEQCKAYMKGGDTGAWKGWLSGLPAKLTAGECMLPLTYTVFDYIDLGHSWQRPVGLCKGDKARISSSEKDKFRVSDTGPWITVAGEPGTKASGADYPCTIEGCLVGMLVGKFVTDSGIETVFPIGAELFFTAPEHGTLSISINDNVWYDNKYFKSATIEDRAPITIEPAE